ncbi:hypothetical protein HHK36_031545 [Tetracentron sinense]|uniref:Plastocyanin-like domain-containing protein n=1 Tax=Tetracentron sinense TaxID=13715 RepID=A0A834YBM3_TETSI|nr:hypothetical protein HHK36_031545 [Tetracentron sinense]
MESWVRVLVLVGLLFPVLVECRVRHYKFNVSGDEEHLPAVFRQAHRYFEWAVSRAHSVCKGRQYSAREGCQPRPIQKDLSLPFSSQKSNLACRNVMGNMVILVETSKACCCYRILRIAGEWWKSDVEDLINEALKSGSAPNVSDAHTINGHPGPVSSCSSQGTNMAME